MALQLQTLRTGWSGGINRSVPAKDIQDHELVDARNLLVTKQSTLRKRAGVAKTESSNSFTGPITSCYHWRLSDGNEAIIVTEDNKVWRSTDTTPPFTFTDITGALGAFSGRVCWVQMDDELWGFYDGTGPNPIYLADTSTAPADGAWSAGEPKFGCVAWRRMWWVDQANPNTLYGSALGDATDYTTTGDSGYVTFTIGDDEDDGITGLWLWNNRLIIFKRSRIYMLLPEQEQIATLASKLYVRPFASGIGCVSHWTIQQVLDDVIFLSDMGVASLAATQQFGEAQHAIISQNIPELATADKSDPELFASFLDRERSLYGLTYASEYASAGETDTLYTMDFTFVGQQGGVSWMAHDGGIVGQSYCTFYYQGRPRVLVGHWEALYWWDESQTDDDLWTTTYDPGDVYFETKAYDAQHPLHRKIFHRAVFEFAAETDPVDYQFTWYIDQNVNLSKTRSGSFSNLVSGDLLGTGPGAGTLGPTGSFQLMTGVSEDTDVAIAVRGKTRRGQTIQFVYRNDDWTQRYSIRKMRLDYTVIPGWRGVGDN